MEFSLEEFNSPSKSFKSNYTKLCKLGNGSFGKVYKAKEIKTDKIIAVKQIPIQNMEKNYKLILKEINVLKNLSHPNIVKYYKFYEENDKIYIIMEYLEGGSLKDFIKNQKNKINEDICRIIIKQILKALSYLHYSCDICHRDIKPENIMFKYKDDINDIKLIDFGLSSNSFEKKNYLDNCGTLIYMAPEQISNKIYSKSVDIWSVGIILYMLLNGGKNPFYNKGDKREKIIERISFKKIEFDDENYPISEMGKDFINKLLRKSPSNRYTSRPALSHPWITMQKFEKIPMTVLDKLLIGEYTNKIKELFLISLFLNYYRKFYLSKKIIYDNNNRNYFYDSIRRKCYTSHSHIKKKRFNITNNEISKNNYNNFDLDEYFQRVKKSNFLLEKKFKENREIMFKIKKNDETSIKNEDNKLFNNNSNRQIINNNNKFGDVNLFINKNNENNENNDIFHLKCYSYSNSKKRQKK